MIFSLCVWGRMVECVVWQVKQERGRNTWRVKYGQSTYSLEKYQSPCVPTSNGIFFEVIEISMVHTLQIHAERWKCAHCYLIGCAYVSASSFRNLCVSLKGLRKWITLWMFPNRERERENTVHWKRRFFSRALCRTELNACWSEELLLIKGNMKSQIIESLCCDGAGLISNIIYKLFEFLLMHNCICCQECSYIHLWFCLEAVMIHTQNPRVVVWLIYSNPHMYRRFLWFLLLY